MEAQHWLYNVLVFKNSKCKWTRVESQPGNYRVECIFDSVRDIIKVSFVSYGNIYRLYLIPALEQTFNKSWYFIVVFWLPSDLRLETFQSSKYIYISGGCGVAIKSEASRRCSHAALTCQHNSDSSVSHYLAGRWCHFEKQSEGGLLLFDSF